MSKGKYIVFFLFLFLGSCKKEPIPTQLPDATNVGANTFGCLINNEIYVPQSRKPFSFGPIPLMLGTYPQYPDYVFAVSTNRKVANTDPPSFKNASVVFDIAQVKGTGEYKIKYGYVDLANRPYNTDSINNGKVTITYLDTLHGIISGTFYFKAKDEYGSTTIEISSGRFDLKN